MELDVIDFVIEECLDPGREETCTVQTKILFTVEVLLSCVSAASVL